MRRIGWMLLGHEDHTEAAFANQLEQFVGADLRPRPFADRRIENGSNLFGRGLEKAVFLVVHAQQGLQPRPETWRSRTGLIEIQSPSLRISDLSSHMENRGFVGLRGIHEAPLEPAARCRPMSQCEKGWPSTQRIIDWATRKSELVFTCGTVDFQAKPASGISPVIIRG